MRAKFQPGNYTIAPWEYTPKVRWRVNPQSRRGVPDLISFRNHDGVFIGVEVKAARDQFRDDQRTFLTELKAASGLAFVAQDFAQFQ